MEKTRSTKHGMQSIGEILQNVLFTDAHTSQTEKTQTLPFESKNLQPTGRYDFDLAEFPLFHFDKNPAKPLRDPITYSDTIVGKDGATIKRDWKVFPSSAYGFGGATTQLVLYDLLQMYIEQGCKANHIQFGTLYNLLQRHNVRNPSSKDYQRLRRDLEILCGCRFHCKNAFWDRERHAYVDMNWQLFNSVFYFKERADSTQAEMPFGFIEVSSVLQQIARTRGFFALGFHNSFFYDLKPLEQRLAIYLAKKFTYQALHQRFVDDLAEALPIDAKRPDNVRAILKNTAQGLLNKHLPILAGFSLKKSARDGRWLAVFHRKTSPRTVTTSSEAVQNLSLEIEPLVRRLIEASGQPEDWRWWSQCAERLGSDGIAAALGQFDETSRIHRVERPGAMLTKILKDVAQARNIAITK